MSEPTPPLPDAFRDINFIHMRCGRRFSEHRTPATADWCEHPAVKRAPVDFRPVAPAMQGTDELREDDCGHESWAGLMRLLDEHWPDDIFPTKYADDPKRDAGPRIVSLVRLVDKLLAERDQAQATVARVRGIHRDNGCGYCIACGYEQDDGRIDALIPWPCPTIAALGGSA